MIDIKELENVIGEIISSCLNDRKFKVRRESEKRNIKVYTGILPPDPEETIIPAITIRTIKAKNSLEHRIITLQISIGIFDDDIESGYTEISEVTQLVFDALIEKGVVKNKFEILPDAEWIHPDAQPIPYYLGFITLNVVYEKAYRTDLEDWVNGKN